MLTYETLLVEQRQQIALATLNRPTALNALNSDLRRDLKQFFTDIQASDEIRLVILTGAGRAFCAGADIKEWHEPSSVTDDREARQQLSFWEAMSRCEQPIIAAINGYALGGGCEVALTADFRFAATDARFGQPEILLGVIPGAGGTQRLPRLVGPSRAKEMVYSGRFYGAAECKAMGLVDEVHPAAEVYQRACAAAAGYAKGPGLALRAAKQVIDAGLEAGLDAGLLLERQAFYSLFATEDAAEGMASFVANGPGKATFRNR